MLKKIVYDLLNGEIDDASLKRGEIDEHLCNVIYDGKVKYI